METQKFKNQEKARGGKNNTKTVLTAAGLSAVAGAASGAVAALKFGVKTKHDKKEDEKPTPEKDEITAQQTSVQQEQSQPTDQQEVSTVNGDDINEPQPTDSTNGTGGTTTNTPTNNQNSPQPDNTLDEVDPDQIAQQIASASETDPNDIDMPNTLIVDGMDIAYGPDGSEIQVAIVHTPDGGSYMLADIDGDGIFSDVFDMSGNYVGVAEGNLTASDLQEAADPTGGYMAYNGNEPVGEDPGEDTVNTGSSSAPNDETLVASNNEEEPADLEDVLAQLLNDNNDSLALNDESKEKGYIVSDEGYPEDEEEAEGEIEEEVDEEEEENDND